MKTIINTIAAIAAVFALASCENFNGDSGTSATSGAITIQLPASSNVSRSISSGGTLDGQGSSIDKFKVVVRNVATKASVSQEANPGATVTIDSLLPGSWDVAIFGYANDPQGSGQSIRYYGNARGTQVLAGLTSYANVVLYDISGNMPGFAFNGVDPQAASNIQYAYMAWSCAELGQSGEEFYSCDFTAGGDPNLKPPVSVFMEPGYTYKAQVTFYGGGVNYPAKYTGSVESVVPQRGGLLEGSVTAVDKEFTPQGMLNGHYVIGNNFADFINSYYYEYDLSSETIQNTDVSYKAVNSEACGVSVPYIASYGSYSCVIMPSVYHPSPVPTVSVPNQTVQKEQTITVSPALNPPAPKAWPKLTTEAEVNGFKRYIVDSANSDSDTWTHALSCSDPNANKVEFNNNDKTLTGKAAGSNSFAWTVTVTAGTYGETPTTPTATANFTATCVEAAQPSGGGGMNYPPDPDWFSFQSSIDLQPEGATGTADELWNSCEYGSEGTKYAAPTPRYVLFGNYPRSHKDSSVTIDETGESQVMGNFTYYKGSDDNWYAKFKTGRMSYYKYYSGTTPGTVGDAVESEGTVAWFKLEPIKWRVLTTNYKGTGKALLVTDEALPGYFDYDATHNDTSHNHYSFEYVYENEYSTPNRTIGGRTIYKNNYQYSNARAWLNGLDGSEYGQQDWTNAGFINSAFTEAGRMKIEETEVDNSASQCYYAFVDQGTDTTYNNYLSDNTTDKVFLLSLNEVTNPLYGFYEYILQYGARVFIPTDLAMASNCNRDSSGGYYFGCITLLRSPDSDTGVKNCSGIGYAGNAESAYNDYNNYFAPAICVDLSDTDIGKVGEGNVAADRHGALRGLFSVGVGKQVKFSQSNLWKNNTASDYHFVSQQYYYCEKNTERGSTEKYNYDLLDYTDATAVITSANIVESDIHTWRLLSSDEWQYLFETRDGAANKFGVAKIVNCDGSKSAYMTGFVLLPDTWTTPPAGISFTPGWTSTDLPETTVNKYNSWEWKKLEEAGAVFLPACGSCRKDGSWSYTYSWTSKYRGLYWNAEHKLVNMAKNQIQSNTNPDYDPYFASIRLVVDAN